MTDSVPNLSAPGKSPNHRIRLARGRASLKLFSLFCASIAALLLASAVGAEEGSEGSRLPPTRSSTSEEESSAKDILCPLLSVEETPERRQFSFRPFYVESEALDGSEKKVQVLWPIYLYRRSDQDFTIRVVPIFTYWKDVYAYEDGLEHNVYYVLFPFVYGGDSTEEGKYFALFPVAGVLKHFLGRDEIRFTLFPLYMEYSKGELHQRNYLWPVLSFSEGGDYNGFRLWPLF